jgi:hypothetical protein
MEIAKKPSELDVDGMKDPNHDITYMGKATRMDDGTWRCLANVEGALCLVEVDVNLSKEDKRSSVFCCSFCGRSGADCEALVAGPMVNICDECVKTAQDCVDDLIAKKKTPVSFTGHVSTNAPCETCIHCRPALLHSNVTPWWSGVCMAGFKLKATINECELYIPAEWKIKKPSGNKFVPPPGEFSGCRCKHCPEREGTGECACCAERRCDDRNPDPDPFV